MLDDFPFYIIHTYVHIHTHTHTHTHTAIFLGGLADGVDGTDEGTHTLRGISQRVTCDGVGAGGEDLELAIFPFHCLRFDHLEEVHCVVLCVYKCVYVCVCVR